LKKEEEKWRILVLVGNGGIGDVDGEEN